MKKALLMVLFTATLVAHEKEIFLVNGQPFIIVKPTIEKKQKEKQIAEKQIKDVECVIVRIDKEFSYLSFGKLETKIKRKETHKIGDKITMQLYKGKLEERL